MIKAKVTIGKSFDHGRAFRKEWSKGDFEEFFQKEGKYCDKLARVAELHGEPGESFTVTYTVTVTV